MGSNVKVVKGNLFSAPKDAIICHACNCQGVWGAGIAKQFRDRYPEAYKTYRDHCDQNELNLVGTCLLIEDQSRIIGCLFTSGGYGFGAENEQKILIHTQNSIKDLIRQNTENRSIHMCKINAGIFNVPWEKTQAVLELYPEQEFTVYEF